MITILGHKVIGLGAYDWNKFRMQLSCRKQTSGFGKCSAKLPANDVFGKYRQALSPAAQ